ncbi:MAG: aromatic ring-hydroxylating oxygenase subunit alpha [Planctomycetales bacterium]
MTMDATVAELIERRRPGHSLEQPFYVSPEIFALDLERIYHRHWLLAGPSCRIPNPGDHFTYQVGNDSLVVARDLSGEIRAFHNVCRHRGSLLCLEETGHAKRLVCPYHAWTYELDGSLCAVRHLPEDFDKAQWGLHPVALHEVAGLIFVCLSDRPPDFSQTAADLAEYLAPHRLERTKICCRRVEIIQANWKTVVENFWECYHCAPTHPEFCSVMSYAHAQNHERLAAERQEFEQRWREETARKGRLIGSIARGPNGLHQGGRLPIRPGFLTQSRGGKPVAPLLGDYSEYDGGITSFTHLPLIWYVVANDYAFLTRFTPRAPLETELELTWLVHKDAVEERDYDPAEVCWMWRETALQDQTICENNQRGILSSRYQPGPYSTAEQTVEEFVRWYLDELRIA